METADHPEHPRSDPAESAEHAEPTHGIRSITAVLGRLQEGHCLDNLAHELQRVVLGVRENQSGKGGSVTLELKVDRVKKSGGRIITLTGTVKSKAPEDPPESTIFFADESGGLHLNDPDQNELFGGPQDS